VAAYDPATTTTTVIDFFLLSPNIEAISVDCINLNFENSDHNPVRIKVKMKGTPK
jgi:exonuclease III